MIKIGDIFEIETPKGLVYIHYICFHELRGTLVRVFNKLFKETPKDFSELMGGKEDYMVFFYVHSTRKKIDKELFGFKVKDGEDKMMKIVKKVGFYPADSFSIPKYMRERHSNGREWTQLWEIIEVNTFKTRYVEKLTDEDKKLSPFASPSAPLLVERIMEGWNLKNWGVELP